MITFLVIGLIVYLIIGVICSVLMLLLDKDMNFDSPSSNWKTILTDYRTWIAIFLVTLFWIIGGIIFVVNTIRDK